MIKSEIINYFRTYLAQGYSEEQLKEALISQGYQEQDITESINSMNTDTDNDNNNDNNNDINLTKNNLTNSSENNIGQSQIQNKLNTANNFNNSKNITTNSKINVKVSSQNHILIGGLIFVVVILISSAIIINLKNGNFDGIISSTSKNSLNSNSQNNFQTTSDFNCNECEYLENGECVSYNCCYDTECDDDDNQTIDVCENKFTINSKCTFQKVQNLNDITENDSSSDFGVIFSKLNDVVENATNSTSIQEICKNDSDCNDENSATQDICRNDGLCIRKIIKECIDADGYCPSGCKIETDNDCTAYELGKCLVDLDCDDNNNATANGCLKNFADTFGTCDFTPITKCINSDNFCPHECTNSNDNDCDVNNLCSRNSDCDDNNKTTTDYCSIIQPKKCIYELITTCTNNDGYCPPSCTNSTDADCGTKTVSNSTTDSIKDECEEDIFCYETKLSELKDKTKCLQITNYWLDPENYFVSKCIFDVSKLSQINYCSEILNPGIKNDCEIYFSDS